jgi:hypothetical protein
MSHKGMKKSKFSPRQINGLLPKWAYGAVFLIPKTIFI